MLLNPRYKSNSTGATSGAETAYPIGAHKIIPFLSGVRAVSFSLLFSEKCFVDHCLFVVSIFFRVNVVFSILLRIMVSS